MNIEKLIKWVKTEGKRRTVTVAIGDPSNTEHVSIFVYDYDLSAGIFIDNVDEIEQVDLHRQKLQELERERAHLEKMAEGRADG